jgi:CheY-like chemotaxis protein
VLLVDEDVGVREVLAAMLEDLGCNVGSPPRGAAKF